jgi:hypothetical protein
MIVEGVHMTSRLNQGTDKMAVEVLAAVRFKL